MSLSFTKIGQKYQDLCALFYRFLITILSIWWYDVISPAPERVDTPGEPLYWVCVTPDDARKHAHEVNETMEFYSFYQWLKTQIERKDIIGDFAHTISQFDEPQPTRKKANGHMIWATWLVDKNASPAVIEAFNLAWNEYQHQVRPS